MRRDAHNVRKTLKKVQTASRMYVLDMCGYKKWALQPQSTYRQPPQAHSAHSNMGGSEALTIKGGLRRVINNSRPGRGPERLNLVRSRKRSQTLIEEWKHVLVCHMKPPSRRICPLAPYTSNLIFWSVCYLYPGLPGGAAGC